MIRRTVIVLALFGIVASGCGNDSGVSEPAPGSAGLEQQAELATNPNESVVLPALNGTLADANLVFSGQPTRAELEVLASANYRVMDLRETSEDRGYEEASVARGLGVEYVNVPVDSAALEDPAVHAAFRRELGLRSEGQPLLVHCASGNRVAGLYYAMLVEEEGLDREAALQRARELGLTSKGVEAAVDAYLDREATGSD